MTWLVDKSALVRLAHSPDADHWQVRIARGLVHISSITLLEVGFSARSASSWVELQNTPPVSDLPVESITPRTESRALEVQHALADRGTHRGPGPADLLIAAIAELSDLTVLHVDKDFELIADITGQPMERLTGDF